MNSSGYGQACEITLEFEWRESGKLRLTCQDFRSRSRNWNLWILEAGTSCVPTKWPSGLVFVSVSTHVIRETEAFAEISSKVSGVVVIFQNTTHNVQLFVKYRC